MAKPAFLLKIADNREPRVYCTVAGLRQTQMSIVDGVCSMTAVGIFLGSTAENQVRHNALSGSADDYELSFEDGTKLRGKFIVQRLDYNGDFNGERNYSVQLESQGKVQSS